MTPVKVAQSRVVPVSVEHAYGATLPMPLTSLFRQWYGPLPPIKEVREQVGPWASPGQTRTVALRGGGTMREELLSTEPPRSFTYRLSNITGALGLLVDHVDGAWSFAAVEDGTDIGWTWTLHPTSTLTRSGVLLLSRMWPGYARQALKQLAEHLVSAGTR